MTEEIKKQILDISIPFSNELEKTVGKLSESGFLIVDPLSSYLSAAGFKNELFEIPANEKHPQVMVIQFYDGTRFIPQGSALSTMFGELAKDWMWI